MEVWQVSYYLSDMYHCYVIEAKNEYEATMKVLKSIPECSKNIFRKLTVVRRKEIF